MRFQQNRERLTNSKRRQLAGIWNNKLIPIVAYGHTRSHQNAVIRSLSLNENQYARHVK